jgi:hypothetical protein
MRVSLNLFALALFIAQNLQTFPDQLQLLVKGPHHELFEALLGVLALGCDVLLPHLDDLGGEGFLVHLLINLLTNFICVEGGR